jgi:hypothetical protein
MQKVFVRLKVLTNGKNLRGAVVSFLFKLIAIKMFNPIDFPNIITKMISLI